MLSCWLLVFLAGGAEVALEAEGLCFRFVPAVATSEGVGVASILSSADMVMERRREAVGGEAADGRGQA